MTQPVLPAAGNAGPPRMPGWNMQGIPPHMLGGIVPPNFFHQMQAALAQENATALVATTKLGKSSTKNKDSDSTLVVRSSVRKLNANGAIISVAQWAKKVVEDNLDWLVKVAKRHYPKEEMILLAYGDGFETLILFDGAIGKMPTNFGAVKKIGVGVSVADADTKMDEAKLAALGVLQSNDSVWEHLRFQQIDTTANKKEKCMYIHTSMTVWGGGIEGRQRVMQVKTKAPGLPYVATSLVPNPVLERQILAKWNGQKIIPTPVAAPAAAASLPMPVLPKPETVIAFNPKELILLEKAFDNSITTRDFKTDVSKYTSDDKKRCQSVIYRANSEIVTSTKKRRKKTPSAKKPPAAAKPVPAADKETPKKKVPAKPKKTPVKAKTPIAKPAPKIDENADSDNEPISNLKPKAATKSPKKAAKSTPKKKEESSKKRRRSSKGGKEEKEPKKKKSKSKTKK